MTVSGDGRGAGAIELDEQSQFSHVRVRRLGNIASLNLVHDDGRETVQSIMNLSRPYELLAPYTRYMFASYLFKRHQRRVLIVGLGAGSMIRYLQKYDPQVHIDVVEIDPLVIKIANKYFGTRSVENTNIITADGFDYLQNTEVRYDVIYMDMFLKPAADTDNMGTPLHLKTIKFYQDIQKKLLPNGLVVFNLLPHPEVAQDIRVIRKAFANIYRFQVE
jgi:spermidine synthase